MKSLKMLISALTACLLVGASSAAMAQMVTICPPDGVLGGTEQAPLMVSEIALNGVSCVISVLIQDNVLATKKGERSVFLYFRVDVGIDRKDVGDDVQVNSHQFVA